MRDNTIAATVMSNLGLSRALHDYGIGVVTTPVGDRHVSERMRADGLSLGGEQSGHVVMLDHATTGDGILTALICCARSLPRRTVARRCFRRVERLPQVLINVPVVDRDRALAAAEPLIAESTAELGGDGRVSCGRAAPNPWCA